MMSNLLPLVALLATTSFAPTEVRRPVVDPGPADFDGVPLDDPLMGLPWHDDLDEAIEDAEASGRPILSLRMLGRLDQELSCANSRFFRTALYSNPEVRRVMTEGFVLHWSSERPVPVLTVDYGDGRTLVRTVTGNSAHFVLDSHGRPVDVIPGLHGPRAFIALLERAMDVAAGTVSLDDVPRGHVLAAWHRAEADRLQKEWSTPVRRRAPAEFRIEAAADPSLGLHVALRAEFLALSKVAIERPLVEAVLAVWPTEAQAGSVDWVAMAASRTIERLDGASRAIFSRKHATDPAAGPLETAIERFESRVAEDGLKNEFELHRKIHEWFARGDAPDDFLALNRRLYDELFLTPANDPWLGLAGGDIYAALDLSLIDREQAPRALPAAN